MTINIEEITSFLGSQTQFVPSRTDNLHICQKDTILSQAQAQIKVENSTEYRNIKIHPSSAPEGFCWLILDYDDKKETGKVPDLPFGLPPTFTVKTPTGAGKQEWYLISEETKKRLPKLKYIIPAFPTVEIFATSKDTDNKWLLTAPGCMKNGTQYILQTRLAPVLASQDLIDTLISQANTDRSQADNILKTNAHTFECDVDSMDNVKQYNKYLNSKVEEFEIGLSPPLYSGDGRDTFIFEQACQGFTYNLSKNKVFEMVYAKIVLNQKVIVDPDDEFNEDTIWIKVDSAHSYIMDADRKSERATNKELEMFEMDSFGQRTVTRETLMKKVEYLSKYTYHHIMSEESLRNMFCETVVYVPKQDLYYIARMLSKKSYDKRFKDSIEHEKESGQIDIQQLLSDKSDTVLHWETYSTKSMNTTFTIPRGKRMFLLTNSPSFKKFSFSCTMRKSIANIDKDIVIDDDIFYMSTLSPIEVAKDATDAEIEQVRTMLNTHLRRIVDTNNFEEESSWLLDRFAHLLQKPSSKIDNAIVFKGSQGSGKTSFIEMLMLIYPRNDTNLILSATDLDNRFTEFARVTHIDDIDINLKNEDVMSKIKALVTTSKVPNEKKFQDRVMEIGTVNLSVSTNTNITDKEVLFGRRWTIFINDGVFLIDDVAKEVRHMFSSLKKDNWRLFEVLHFMLMTRDVTKFNGHYATYTQRQLRLENRKGGDFTVAIANMIENYGYISAECQPFTPGELMNRSDFVVATQKHYNMLDSDIESIQEPESLTFDKGTRIKSSFGGIRDDRVKVGLMYSRIFEDANKRVGSKINSEVGVSWSNKVPPIRKWIELLTFLYMGTTDIESIRFIVDKFSFDAQWEWDNTTKPDIENLGTLNVYDHAEIDSFDDEDY